MPVRMSLPPHLTHHLPGASKATAPQHPGLALMWSVSQQRAGHCQTPFARLSNQIPQWAPDNHPKLRRR